MGELARLVVFAELEGDEDSSSPSVRVRLDVELSGGSRVTVLDDRGFDWSVGIAWQGENVDAAEIEKLRRELDPWSGQSEQDIGELAWAVVGPDSDDPSEGQTVEESHAEYWAYLAGLLREQGIQVEPAVLQALPYDVELGDRVRARIARAAPPPRA